MAFSKERSRWSKKITHTHRRLKEHDEDSEGVKMETCGLGKGIPLASALQMLN